MTFGEILSIIVSLLGRLFGIGKPDPEAQGEVSGKAQATASQALQELHDEDVADTAAESVVGDVRLPDAHERPGD